MGKLSNSPKMGLVPSSSLSPFGAYLLSGKLRYSLIVIFLLGCFANVYGQIQAGQPASAANATPIPGSGHDYIHLLSETVDPASGSVNLNINFGAPKGRGIALPATYNYASSNLYSITQDAITQVIQFEQSGLMRRKRLFCRRIVPGRNMV